MPTWSAERSSGSDSKEVCAKLPHHHHHPLSLQTKIADFFELEGVFRISGASTAVKQIWSSFRGPGTSSPLWPCVYSLTLKLLHSMPILRYLTLLPAHTTQLRRLTSSRPALPTMSVAP